MLIEGLMPFCYMILGKKVTTAGMKMHMRSTMIMAMRYGMEPEKISPTVMSFMPFILESVDFTANTFIPKGGVIMPVSMAMIMTMPHQTRS